jgi:hypothetical protein
MFRPFKLSFVTYISALFGLTTVWALFSKNWAVFLKSFGHPAATASKSTTRRKTLDVRRATCDTKLDKFFGSNQNLSDTQWTQARKERY